MELCRDLIGKLLPEDDLLELNKALFNAANYLPRKARCNFKTFSIATGFSKGHINYSNSKEILHKLYECITQKNCCSLSYQKEVNGTIKEYYFAPKRIICLRDTLYIKGWIVDDQHDEVICKHPNPTNFSVHRIQDIHVLEDKSSEALSDVIGNHEMFGLISENEPFKVILRFTNPHAITYVADRIWSSDQKLEFNEDGSLTLSFTTDSYYETFTFALSFGRGVEVISPEELREEVKAEIKEMKKIY
ncbi:WYL domain-containing protein [Succinivibrio dextrinosolvens]|uniref:WYL domain-containing protein n=2 Tax=Succinivibrio dextrinosolvens TaxID=83771 RepID=A0A662Z912_9GAMM|nr:WYL domain-containing protein [Succinivibrio dextrinosolvens]